MYNKRDTDYTSPVSMAIYQLLAKAGAVTYSEVARDVFNQDIDWLYDQMELGTLTKDDFRKIKDYVKNYKMPKLNPLTMRTSACYNMIEASFKQLANEWQKNCAERAMEKQYTSLNMGMLENAIKHHLIWDAVGLSEEDAVKWLNNEESKVYEALGKKRKPATLLAEESI